MEEGDEDYQHLKFKEPAWYHVDREKPRAPVDWSARFSLHGVTQRGQETARVETVSGTEKKPAADPAPRPRRWVRAEWSKTMPEEKIWRLSGGISLLILYFK